MIEENRKKRVTMTQETINKILKLKLLILLPPQISEGFTFKGQVDYQCQFCGFVLQDFHFFSRKTKQNITIPENNTG